MGISRRVFAVTAALVILACAGCGAAGGSGGRIEGANWVLRQYDSNGTMKNVPAGANADALFEKGSVSGFSGVNTYRGSCKISGASLAVSNLSSTLMAGPQGLMDLERIYLANLHEASSFTGSGTALTIFDGSGKKVLVYGRGPARSLVGVSWNAINYYNGRDALLAIQDHTPVTALFSQDGAISGSDGVNDYRAEYKTSGQGITISNVTPTTSRTDPNEAMNRQAQDYLAALRLATRYKLTSTGLELFRSNGAFAVTYLAPR